MAEGNNELMYDLFDHFGGGDEDDDDYEDIGDLDVSMNIRYQDEDDEDMIDDDDDDEVIDNGKEEHVLSQTVKSINNDINQWSSLFINNEHIVSRHDRKTSMVDQRQHNDRY